VGKKVEPRKQVEKEGKLKWSDEDSCFMVDNGEQVRQHLHVIQCGLVFH
jgi:hypothetical protein